MKNIKIKLILLGFLAVSCLISNSAFAIQAGDVQSVTNGINTDFSKIKNVKIDTNTTANSVGNINWYQFNIPSEQTVNYNFRAANQTLLNRVTGSTASEIYGNIKITGNQGTLLLSNPNGIMFSGGKAVLGFASNGQKQSLTLTDMEITDSALADFMANPENGVALINSLNNSSGILFSYGAQTRYMNNLTILSRKGITVDGTTQLSASNIKLVTADGITYKPYVGSEDQVDITSYNKEKTQIKLEKNLTTNAEGQLHGNEIEITSISNIDEANDAVVLDGDISTIAFGNDDAHVNIIAVNTQDGANARAILNGKIIARSNKIVQEKTITITKNYTDNNEYSQEKTVIDGITNTSDPLLVVDGDIVSGQNTETSLETEIDNSNNLISISANEVIVGDKANIRTTAKKKITTIIDNKLTTINQTTVYTKNYKTEDIDYTLYGIYDLLVGYSEEQLATKLKITQGTEFDCSSKDAYYVKYKLDHHTASKDYYHYITDALLLNDNYSEGTIKADLISQLELPLTKMVALDASLPLILPLVPIPTDLGSLGSTPKIKKDTIIANNILFTDVMYLPSDSSVPTTLDINGIKAGVNVKTGVINKTSIVNTYVDPTPSETTFIPLVTTEEPMATALTGLDSEVERLAGMPSNAPSLNTVNARIGQQNSGLIPLGASSQMEPKRRIKRHDDGKIEVLRPLFNKNR